LPNAPKPEVAKVLTVQLSALLPVRPEEVSFDFMLTDDVQSDGRLAVVCAVKSDHLRLALSHLATEGLSAEAVVPTSIGHLATARSQALPSAAIVESAEGGMTIDVWSNGNLCLSRFVAGLTSDTVADEVCRSFAVAKLPCGPLVAAGGLSLEGADVTTANSALALLSNGPWPIQIELPEVVAKRERQKVEKVKRYAIWLWFAAITLTSIIWLNRWTTSRDAAAVEARWKKRLSDVSLQQRQASAKLNQLAAQASTLATGFEPKQRLVDVIALAAAATPEGVWLTGMTLERGKPINLRGTAMTSEAVAMYLEKLAGMDRFREVKLAFANNAVIEGINVVQFSMTAHVIGNLPLVIEDVKR
jgi:hypothetical protein